jgi:hypothetical protein
MRVSTCKSCGARIIWARTSLGAKMPIDQLATSDGNAVVVGRVLGESTPIVVVLTRDSLARAREQGDLLLYRSHFASCPDAEQWRRPTTQEAPES